MRKKEHRVRNLSPSGLMCPLFLHIFSYIETLCVGLMMGRYTEPLLGNRRNYFLDKIDDPF